MKRATYTFTTPPPSAYISIHALVKRATVILAVFFSDDNFNPRPREEGDIITLCAGALQKYFNPRPREEGDVFEHVFYLYDP